MSLLYKETTGKIIGAYYKVHFNWITQVGCSQKNDVKALGSEMRERGLKVREQHFIHRKYLGTWCQSASSFRREVERVNAIVKTMCEDKSAGSLRERPSLQRLNQRYWRAYFMYAPTSTFNSMLPSPFDAGEKPDHQVEQ